MKYKCNNDIKMNIPKDVDFIIKKLEENGYEAFAVGGCVRDTILGREPKDWDITTSALPQKVKEIFRRTLDTGLQHGTVTVMLKHIGYEVTTYRIDGEYKDSRHPESVEFTTNLIEDLKRRDFTINAMAYNSKYGVVDAFDGIGDLQRKVIKCVNDPEERFTEDALRMLRAVRFSAQLGFEIEEKTEKAIKKLAPTLEKISAERICAELEKLILSDNPDKLIEAYNLGITKVVLPEFDAMMECKQDTPYHMYNVGEHTIKVMENVENDLLEAAESLGANKIVAFFKVIFPLSLPGLIVGTVLVFTGALTAYTTPQLLGGNKNTVLATLIYQKTMTLGDWQGAAVVATIMIVVTLIVVKTINFLASRLDKRGVS